MYEKNYQSRVLKSGEKTKNSRTRLFSWKKVLIILSILFFLGLVIFLLRQPKLQITNVEVVGTTVLDNEDISQSVKDQLVGRRLWLFPRTSVFLINEKGIGQNLKKQFSRIETVSIKRTSGHTLTISISEFRALYLWCIPSGEDCYFMDKQGVVYTPAPVFSGTAYPKVITGDSLKDLPFNVMSETEVNRIATLYSRLSDINIVPILFKNVSEREMEIDFLHNKTIAKVLIDPTIDTETSLDYLFSGIRTQPLSGLFASSEKKLLYIDVRFSNKVVYKFE